MSKEPRVIPIKLNTEPRMVNLSDGYGGAAYQDGTHIIVVIPFGSETSARYALSAMPLEDAEAAQKIINLWKEGK